MFRTSFSDKKWVATMHEQITLPDGTTTTRQRQASEISQI
jgi:hypothetical protein